MERAATVGQDEKGAHLVAARPALHHRRDHHEAGVVLSVEVDALGQDIQTIEPGGPATFAVFETETTYRIDPERFASKGRATPFAGREVRGRCVLNVVRGREVWRA